MMPAQVEQAMKKAVSYLLCCGSETLFFVFWFLSHDFWNSDKILGKITKVAGHPVLGENSFYWVFEHADCTKYALVAVISQNTVTVKVSDRII